MMRKICLIFTMILVLSGFNVVQAAKISDTQLKTFDDKVISDVNKVWIVKFKDTVDFNTVKDNITVKDLNGVVLKVNIFPGSSADSVNILPPSGGYKMNHTYKITINKSLKSGRGKLLNKIVTMKFKVSNNPSDYPTPDPQNPGGKTDPQNPGGNTDPQNPGGNTDTYKIHAKVVVSQVLTIFKQVTIDSTTVPSGTKFKFDNSSKIYNIKDTALMVASGDTVKVYIMDDNLNVLGTFTLDVSNSNNDLNIQSDK